MLQPQRHRRPARVLGQKALSLLLICIGALGLLTGPAAALDSAAGFQDSVDYTLTNQSGRDFSGQQLANTSFAGAVGKAATFAGANLHGAILTQGAFPQANFAGADLSDALMDRTDMSDTNLRGAVLVGVIAAGANFHGADVTDADFTDALLDRVDQRALCATASGTNPITGAETRLSLGC